MNRRLGKAWKKTAPGRLRIVAGMWRSRVLDIPDVPGLRPTPARVRETLFNWLGPGIEGARCLDLFAGSGALGFEALSRGAGETVFVDQSKAAARYLERNAALLGAGGAVVERADAFEYLRRPGAGRFDVVFLDPPFAGEMLGDLCRLLDECGRLKPCARVYLEQDRATPQAELPQGWHTDKDKTAGQVRYMLARTGA